MRLHVIKSICCIEERTSMSTCAAHGERLSRAQEKGISAEARKGSRPAAAGRTGEYPCDCHRLRGELLSALPYPAEAARGIFPFRFYGAVPSAAARFFLLCGMRRAGRNGSTVSFSKKFFRRDTQNERVQRRRHRRNGNGRAALSAAPRKPPLVPCEGARCLPLVRGKEVPRRRGGALGDALPRSRKNSRT